MSKTSAVQDYVNSIQNKIINEVAQENICNYMQELNYSVNNIENIRCLSNGYQIKCKMNRHEILEQLINELSIKQEILIQEQLNNQIKELQLTKTKHPNYMISSSGKYYHLVNNKYEQEDSIININDDGNYIVKTAISDSSGFLLTTYDINNDIVTIKVLNNNGDAYRVEKFVAKKLNMKQEFVNKYKLRGYSGNSSGIFGVIGNIISKPIPTGYYFSKNFKFFKWNRNDCQFELQKRDGNNVGSPLLADYDVMENIVVRTDYDGAGMVL